MRVLGLLFLALSGYYLRLYVVRGEPVTLIQVGVLLGASALLLVSPPALRRWPPVGWRDGLVSVAGLALAAAFVISMDRDAHSASDTLNRVAPTLGLWLALGLRLRAERAEHTA